MLQIEIAHLAEGVHEVELEPTAEDLGLEPEKFTDIRVHARLDYHDDRILAMLDAVATATLECDRTLKLFEQEIEGSHHVLFGPPELVDAREDEEEDVRPLLPADRHIDITSAVRDTLMLAIPARCIAPGAEEEEIPTRFGGLGENEVDPRWEALKALKSSSDDE